MDFIKAARQAGNHGVVRRKAWGDDRQSYKIINGVLFVEINGKERSACFNRLEDLEASDWFIVWPQIEVGDEVKEPNGRIGIVKYIGSCGYAGDEHALVDFHYGVIVHPVDVLKLEAKGEPDCKHLGRDGIV